MKIKRDFVTNSSSTSFIVAFPKKIETIDDVKKFIREDKAEVVFREALEQSPIRIDFQEDGKEDIELIKLIHNVLLKRCDEYTAEYVIEDIKNEIKSEFPEIMVPISQVKNIMMKFDMLAAEEYRSVDYDPEELEDLILKNNKGFLYLFYYSDEEGSFASDMEHGGTFNELPHIEISNH